jgi:sucrose phosphorylase
LSESDIDEALTKPVVKGLVELIHVRNNTNAFNGHFSVTEDTGTLLLVWTLDEDRAELRVEMSTLDATITLLEGGLKSTLSLAKLTA